MPAERPGQRYMPTVENMEVSECKYKYEIPDDIINASRVRLDATVEVEEFAFSEIDAQ